jgi:uncharacterized membrane protein (Fun14 family)
MNRIWRWPLLTRFRIIERKEAIELQIGEFVFSGGGGFLFATASGYAIKKVMKIAAGVVGLFVAALAALAYLVYKGLIDVKWVAMENVTRSALTNVSGQIVQALNNTSTQFASHPSAVSTSVELCERYPPLCTLEK